MTPVSVSRGNGELKQQSAWWEISWLNDLPFAPQGLWWKCGLQRRIRRSAVRQRSWTWVFLIYWCPNSKNFLKKKKNAWIRSSRPRIGCFDWRNARSADTWRQRDGAQSGHSFQSRQMPIGRATLHVGLDVYPIRAAVRWHARLRRRSRRNGLRQTFRQLNNKALNETNSLFRLLFRVSSLL